MLVENGMGASDIVKMSFFFRRMSKTHSMNYYRFNSFRTLGNSRRLRPDSWGGVMGPTRT